MLEKQYYHEKILACLAIIAVVTIPLYLRNKKKKERNKEEYFL